jgi:acetyl-CoA decarbonylase/synthase complex subunit delta
MEFEIPKDTNVGRVEEITIGATKDNGGTRSNTITIGGGTAVPLHFFEGDFPHRPIIAMDVFDKIPDKYPDPLLEYYQDVIKHPEDMAKKCVNEFGAEMINIRLEATHPEKGNKSANEAAEIVKQILDTINVPLIITGHSHFGKNNDVMKTVCEITAGENCLINWVETDNYKTIAAACIAFDHTIVAQSPIDVNIAKQLNILLTDMNIPKNKIVMDPLTSTLGYGLEYTYSIMERIRIDALAGDKMLAFPMMINPGYESFRVKESRVLEKDYPMWGDEQYRGAYWEIVTASSLLLTGAELIVMHHPKAVELIKKKIDEIYNQKILITDS